MVYSTENDGYIKILKEHSFTISMSRKGNPYDNAQAESFMKKLKEEVKRSVQRKAYVSEYRTFAEVETGSLSSLNCYAISSGYTRRLVISVPRSLNKRSSWLHGMYQFQLQHVRFD